MRYSCIGSRVLTAAQIVICSRLGYWIVYHGHQMHSGNAPGADQAFAKGANLIHPELVHLHLPWYNFERHAIHDENVVHNLDELPERELRIYTSVAAKFHPRFEFLSQGVKKLMIRNSSILMPPPDCFLVDMCLALPSEKKGGGGTGQGMRIAEHEKVKLIDLRHYDRGQLRELCEEIAGRGKS